MRFTKMAATAFSIGLLISPALAYVAQARNVVGSVIAAIVRTLTGGAALGVASINNRRLIQFSKERRGII
jgi:hypothetical protein